MLGHPAGEIPRPGRCETDMKRGGRGEGRPIAAKAAIGKRPVHHIRGKERGGASGRVRTTDTAIFSRMLYQLSYRGIYSACGLPKKTGERLERRPMAKRARFGKGQFSPNPAARFRPRFHLVWHGGRARHNHHQTIAPDHDRGNVQSRRGHAHRYAVSCKWGRIWLLRAWS